MILIGQLVVMGIMAPIFLKMKPSWFLETALCYDKKGHTLNYYRWHDSYSNNGKVNLFFAALGWPITWLLMAGSAVTEKQIGKLNKDIQMQHELAKSNEEIEKLLSE